MNKPAEMRFEFGKNWSKFVRSRFSQERCDVAKKWMLDFARRSSFEATDFLDIGCGSGLHSLAAWQSGASRVHSFDYDANSVAATRMLWEYAGRTKNWTVEQGDALNEDYVRSLGKWNFVYSWGVLHHTGQMWQAVLNAQSAVADGVLGKPAENSLRHSLTLSGGSVSIFFTRPIAATFIALAMIAYLFPVIQWLIRSVMREKA